MKKLTNKAIAEILGVSPATVSYALNDKPGVSPELKRKIYDLIRENSANDMPILQQKGTVREEQKILFVVYKRHGEIITEKPFFSLIMETVQLEAQHSSYVTEIFNYTSEMEIDSFIHLLNSRNAAGAVILATEMLEEDLSPFKTLNFPFVLLDSSFGPKNYDCITIDNTNDILKAFKYAYNKGHRDIGYLKCSVFINNFGYRHDGFRKAIHDFGLSDYNHHTFSLHADLDTAYRQMSSILDHQEKDFQMPTCFLADLDYIAIGAMRAFKEHGYNIPEDISFIGYDDVKASEICSPQLTTIRVNQRDIGRVAVKVLIDKIKNPRDYYLQVNISSDLIERDSVKHILSQ